MQAPSWGGGENYVGGAPGNPSPDGTMCPWEKWRVRCALYGFTESPSDWGHFRDETLRGLQWVEDGEEYRVEPTGEPHLWRIVKKSQEERLACGYLAIYVDDVVGSRGGKGPQVLLQSCEETLEMFRRGDGVAGRVDALLWL